MDKTANFPTQKICEKSGIIHIIHVWIFLFASAFDLLWYVVFVERCEEDPSSYKYVVEKGRNILVDFQITVDILWYYTKTPQVFVS